MRYRVTNRGVGPTNQDGWTDTIWLTRNADRPSPGIPPQDGTILENDYLIGSFGHSGALGIGESYEVTVNVTLPSGKTGELYITPWSDAYDVVLEDTIDIYVNPGDPNALDGNNYSSRPITVLLAPPPDLVVASVLPQASAIGGQDFTVQWTVRNDGAAEIGGGWIDTVYLTDTTTLEAPGANALFLGTFFHDGALAPGQNYTEQRTFALSPAAAGAISVSRRDEL